MLYVGLLRFAGLRETERGFGPKVLRVTCSEPEPSEMSRRFAEMKSDYKVVQFKTKHIPAMILDLDVSEELLTNSSRANCLLSLLHGCLIPFPIIW